MSSTGPNARELSSVASNVLVRLPQYESTVDVRRRYGHPGGDHVVAVTYRSPEAWVEEYADAVESRPLHPVVVDVGERRRPGTIRTDRPGVGATVEPVPSSEDLARLARRVDDRLDARPDERVVVYFDSVTELLRHVDPEAAFRLLHVLTSRVRSADATAYYRFEEGVHDSRVLEKLTPVFDTELFSPGVDGEV